MARNKIPGAPPAQPYVPPPWEAADVYALQALSRGSAEPHQQKRALDYIIRQLAGTYDMSFRPTGDRDTVFAEGRRFVGLQLVKLLSINLEKLKHD